MQQETLQAAKRVTKGSRASNRLRREGRVPAVVYGTAMDPQPVHVSSHDLFVVLNTEAGLNAIIELDIDGTPVLTVARELQRNPVRGDIEHVDFIEVRMDTEIQAEVGLELLGIPEGVKEDGGILETLESSVSISALPNQIPSSIEVDVTSLGIGDTLKVEDLPSIDGVTYLGDPEHALVTVVHAKAEVEPEEELELFEGEEPEVAAEAEEAEAVEDEG
jgi:large subunit ribosomal protein L25